MKDKTTVTVEDMKKKMEGMLESLQEIEFIKKRLPLVEEMHKGILKKVEKGKKKLAKALQDFLTKYNAQEEVTQDTKGEGDQNEQKVEGETKLPDEKVKAPKAKAKAKVKAPQEKAKAKVTPLKPKAPKAKAGKKK